MNRFFYNILKNAALFLVAVLGIFLFLMIVIPKAKPILVTSSKMSTQVNNKEVIHFLAIGDSLTEGIGDSTNSGGFVPLVARDLEEHYRLNGIQIDNFGKNGDRSDQILKRIKNNEDIQKGLSTADIITLTVGGNDLMKVIKGDIFSLTKESFKKPLKNYQKQIAKLMAELRKYNEHAPIYVLGIYNPFYLYFPEITEMQEIVNSWNEGTKETVTKDSNAYFIPINDLLYKGKGDNVGIVSEDGSTTSEKQDIENNALYEEDRFHPNNLGYQLIASAVRDELIRTQEKWLPKKDD